MKWTKVKRNIESLICDKLKHRLNIHLTQYNVSLGDQKRIWITLDKKEVFNASSANYLMEHDKLWTEIKKKTDKPFPDCLYECFPEFIGSTNDLDYTTVILEDKGIFNVDQVYDTFTQYPQLSIDNALNSESVIIKVIALLDKRLGKRKLKNLKYSADVHPLILGFYKLRCEVEGIMTFEDILNY